MLHLSEKQGTDSDPDAVRETDRLLRSAAGYLQHGMADRVLAQLAFKELTERGSLLIANRELSPHHYRLYALLNSAQEALQHIPSAEKKVTTLRATILSRLETLVQRFPGIATVTVREEPVPKTEVI